MSTYNHVRDLFADEANERAWFGVPAHWLKLARHVWLMAPMQARLVRRIRTITRNVEDMSLRISGYAHRYPRLTDLASDADEQALQLAQSSEAHFLGVRKSVLEMIQTVKPAAKMLPALWQALADWNSAAVDAFEAAQELRWVVLECQAQRDIDQGRIQSFDSAAEAIASLRN
jgi:hypothetical protein